MFSNTLTFFEKGSDEPVYTTAITSKTYDTAINIKPSVFKALELNDFRTTVRVESIIKNDDQAIESNTYTLMFDIERLDEPNTDTDAKPNIKKINWMRSRYKLIRTNHKNLTNEQIDRNKSIYTIGDLMDEFHTHAVGLLSANDHAYERFTNDDYYKLAQQYLNYHSNLEPIASQMEELIWSYANEHHII